MKFGLEYSDEESESEDNFDKILLELRGNKLKAN